MTTNEIKDLVAHKLRSENEKERALHEPSGKLSAGMLYQPLLEQVLKLIGVPQKPVDDYTLGLFKRGKQVEEWLVSMLDGEEQVEVEYRNTIGFIDKVLDGKPVEIKSVKSSQWKWLEKDGVKWSHRLQGGLYALGTDCEEYQVIYVSADDFRLMCFELHTADIKDDVDGIITQVEKQLKKRVLPVFEPREDWQGKDTYHKYSNFPEWLSLDENLLMGKLEKQFPDAFNKLTKG